MASSILASAAAQDGRLIEPVRRGLPAASLEELASRLKMTQAEAASVFGIAPRTLSRRLKARRRLTPAESDRLARVARVLAWAIHILGSEANAAAWLRQPNRALLGERPLDLLDTDPGAAEVTAVLGRIGFGGYS